MFKNYYINQRPWLTPEDKIAVQNVLSLLRDAPMKMSAFPHYLNNKLKKENQLYFENGNCNPSKREDTVAANPTLLNPKSLKWQVDPSSCPFDTYLPLPLDELDIFAEEGIATRYCQKVLKNLVAEFRNKKKNITFHFHTSDDLQFCLSQTQKFDVIDTSTLADTVGLANVLLSCGPLLEFHTDALLLTESVEWGNLTSTPSLYVEESLCASLRIIPTMYGLEMASRGDSTILMENPNPLESQPLTLSWRISSRLDNCPTSASSLLESCLNKLEKKCFSVKENEPTKATCGLLGYTPLTFSFLTARMAKFGLMKNFEPEILPEMALARKTLQDWMECRPTVIVMTTIPCRNCHDPIIRDQQAPWLRAVLLPNKLCERERGVLQKCRWVNFPDVHYIDNLNLRYQKNPDDSVRRVQVSFLLPQYHGLERTHSGAIVDLMTGYIFYDLGEIEEMCQQQYRKYFPILSRSPTNKALPEDFHAQVLLKIH